MTMTLSNPPPASAHTRPADGAQAPQRSPGPDSLGPPVDAALRQAFERALARQAGGGWGDEASAPATDSNAAVASPVFVAAAACDLTRFQPEPEALVFASSQPVAPPPQALPQGEAATAGPGTQPMPATLGAALSALTMPASPEGPQHWQFSFAQAGSAVAGVTLSAQPQAPWLVQVNLQAHALSSTALRERSALDARLGELRQRLLGRGAHIDGVELLDTHDPTRHR